MKKKFKNKKNGIYIAKVSKDKVRSIVEAISTSSTTKVKINETSFRVKSSKEKVDLVENVTKVSIIAKNGADEQKEYELYIVKEETNEDEDVSLKEVNADGKLANLNADGVYEVNVKATQTKVDLKSNCNTRISFSIS